MRVFRQRKYTNYFGYTNIYSDFFVAGGSRPLSRFVGLDDAPFRFADEAHEVVAFGAPGHLPFDLVAAVHVVQSALEQDAAGIVDLGDAFRREAAAREADLVDAGEAQRVVADDDVGGQVLTEERAALNHRVRTDVGPLVDGRMAADHDPVADMHLARERNAVGDDATAADHAVVAYVHVGHQQVAVADTRGAGRGRAAADGDVFADVVVVADFAEGFLARELEVLRQARNRGGGVDPAAFADARAVVDHGAGADPAAVADHDVARDAGERFDDDVVAQLRVGVDVCQLADHGYFTFLFLTIWAIIWASHASVSPTNALPSTTATPRRMGSSSWISNCSVSPGTTLRLNFTLSIFMK